MTIFTNDEYESDTPRHAVIGWNNVVTAANITADSENTNYPVTNLANPSTNLLWVSDFEGDQYLTIALPSTATGIDYVAIAHHNFGSTGVSVQIEGMFGNNNVWKILHEAETLEDNSPIMFRFGGRGTTGVSFETVGGGDGAYGEFAFGEFDEHVVVATESTAQAQPDLTDIRIRLGQGDAGTVPYAAVVYVGSLLVMERGVQGDFTPLPFGRITNVVNGFTESGAFVGRIITNARRSSLARFIGLDQDWMRENLEPFLAQATEKPFFFAWAPEDYPDETCFAWLEADAHPIIGIEGYVSIDLQMSGIMDVV